MKSVPNLAAASLAATLAIFPMSDAAAQDQSSEPAPFVLPPLADSQDVESTVAYGENENTREVALRGWALFQDAWAKNEWDEFLAITTDDFEFYFPNPPHHGMHRGEAGKWMLVDWATGNREAGYLIRGVTFAATIAGNRAVFEVQSGAVEGDGYRNVEAIVLEVEGDRISALREYWLVLDPSNTTIEDQ